MNENEYELLMNDYRKRSDEQLREDRVNRRFNNVLGGIAPIGVAGGLLYMGYVRGNKRVRNVIPQHPHRPV